MATLDELLRGGLSNLLQQDPQGLEDSLYESSAADIERRSGDTARGINENTFGRGLGLSTVTRDLQADRERLRMDALVKARRDAAMGSRQAVLQALAQAAGLQTADANRRQQASQFAASQGFAEKQAGRQEDIANRQMLMQGIGGLGGAALTTGGLIYGPEIKGALNRLMGGGGGGAPSASPALGGDLTGGAGQPFNAGGADLMSAMTDAAPDFDLSYDFDIPDFSLDTGGSFDLPSLDAGSFEMGDFDLFGGMGDSTLDTLLRGGFTL